MDIDTARAALREHPELGLEMSLTSLQLMALQYIKSKPFVSGTDLAREMCGNKDTVRRLMDHLIKKGYAEEYENIYRVTCGKYYRAI